MNASLPPMPDGIPPAPSSTLPAPSSISPAPSSISPAPSSTSQAPVAIALALISHTNTGKTTLARTLLGRDVGEVRDAAHVTVEATPYTLIADDNGDALLLWDTPGFGDSARLARRLARQGNPIGWFLSEVWDRFRDRPFFLAQKAVRAVQDDADVVLYLVNAAENPGDAGYLGPELDVLAWIGRPVVVLLNQTGPPRPPDVEAAELARWRVAIGTRPFVREVLPLDAFARCWVQEIVLLRAIGPLLADDRRAVCERLVQLWQARRTAQFNAAIEALAVPLALAARDAVTLPGVQLGERLRGAVRSLISAPAESPERHVAAQQLAERLDHALQASTARLLAVHGLSGRAAETVRDRLAGRLRTDAPVAEGKAALMGGIVSGALSGLAADIATGGLSFGAGTLVGAVAGALGSAGVARGYNVLRGRTTTTVRWDTELLDELFAEALLRYLAVAHFGRGRGEWQEPEYPGFWRDVVAAEIDAHRHALAALWRQRDGSNPGGSNPDGSNPADSNPADSNPGENFERAVQEALAASAARLLVRLYPEADAARG